MTAALAPAAGESACFNQSHVYIQSLYQGQAKEACSNLLEIEFGIWNSELKYSGLG